MPVTVAWSLSDPAPIVMFGEAMVVIRGCALATVDVSPASLQAPLTGALLTSPL